MHGGDFPYPKKGSLFLMSETNSEKVSDWCVEKSKIIFKMNNYKVPDGALTDATSSTIAIL